MLEADDSVRACIPAYLQRADLYQLRQAEIGHERPFAHNRFLTGQRLPPFDRGLRIIPTMDAGMAHC